MRSRLLGSLALSVAVFGATACALMEEEEKGSSPGEVAAPSPHGEVDAGQAAAGSHSRHLRCSRCHDAEARAADGWRERARSIGHDLSRIEKEGKTCNCCHLGLVQGFQDPIDERCLECHEDIKVTIPAMGKQHCIACHDFDDPEAERWLRETAWECQRCHATRQGEQKAIDVHGASDCSGCHQPHAEPWVKARGCLDCHPSQDVKHAEKPVVGALACDDCHKPHEKAQEASGRCAECHKKTEPELVSHATFKGHDTCKTCHAPHAFDKASARDCKQCHSKVPLMGISGRGEKEHADCQSCHAPHDARAAKENPSGTCEKCHSSVHPSHPDPKGKACTNCHDPHPAAEAASSRAACSTCHEAAHGDKGFHAGVECTKCHTPHAFAGKEAATCQSCHQNEHTRASREEGHATCTNCHEKHRPLPVAKSCDGCHTTEHASAPKGHQDCRRCHDAHDGSRGPAAACNACHAEEARSPHGKKGCEDCHRAHGPNGPAKPPGCETCHAPSKLPALHALPGHQACASCHTSHGPPKSDRKTCIPCHQKQEDHEVMARSCAGCHRFRGSR